MTLPNKRPQKFRSTPGAASALVAASVASASNRFAQAQNTLARQPTAFDGASAAADAPPDVPRASVPAPSATSSPTAWPATPVPPGELEIDLALIGENPFNARRVYHPEITAQRAASIAQAGQLMPALVCHDWREGGAGRYILIAGHYRKRALELLNRTSIRAKLVPCSSDVELFRLSYIENGERDAGTPLDDALVWSDLLKQGVVTTHEQLAEITRKPRTHIVKTLAIAKLPAAALAALGESPSTFTLTAGYLLSQLASMAPAETLHDLARKVADGELSTRELERLREQYASGVDMTQQRAPKKMGRRYPVGKIGFLREFDSGRVLVDITLVDPQRRVSVVHEILQRLEREAADSAGAAAP